MSLIKEALYQMIGSRIKSHRESTDLSQLELSEKLHISRSSISNIEVGRHQVPLFTLYEISKELNVNIKDLIPTFDEVNAFSTGNYQDFSTFISSDLDSSEKSKLNEFLSNI